MRGAAATLPARGLFPQGWDVATAASSPKERGLGPRPALSPLMAGALSAWLAVTAACLALMDEGLGRPWATFPAVRTVLTAGVVLLCVLAAVAWRVPGSRPWCLWAALGLVGGGVAGALFMGGVLGCGEALTSGPVSGCTVVVETDPRRSSAGNLSFQGQARFPDGRGGRVLVELGRWDGGVPAMGQELRCTGRWAQLDLANEYDRSLAQRGVAARLKASSFEELGYQAGAVGAVRVFRQRLLEALAPDGDAGRALTAGVVCGDQAALAGFAVQDNFSDLGLSHLVAVSGSHLAVVAALLGRGLRGMRAGPAIRLVLTAAVLAVYVVFTGLQPSAIRSWIMAVASSGAIVAGRRSHAVSAVCAAALAMVVSSPSSAASMGFQLSVLSVLGLTLFSGFAQSWLACVLPARVPSFAVEAFALTLVSTVFTAPVCLPAFGTVPLLSPLANAVAGPLVSLLLVAGVACGPLAALWPAAAPVALLPCDVLARGVCGLSETLAAVPGAVYAVDVGPWEVGVPLVLGAALLYGFWPAPRSGAARVLAAACALGLLGLHLLWGVFAPARVVVLDVGQGDAILLQDGRHAVLVDTGPGDAVVDALARQHVRRLDAVLLTHTDLDHVGGLDDLAGRVRVGSVVVARGVSEALGDDGALADAVREAVGDNVLEVGSGDAFSVGDFWVEVVWPCDRVSGAENEESVVAVAGYCAGGRSLSVLLTGDAERAVVEPLLEQGRLGTVDVLKVGHHGSAVSTTPTMVRSLAPLVAVASAGENNRYGHPTEECVNAIAGEGVPFHCTATCGDVELRPAAQGVEVRCSNHGAQGFGGLGFFAV